MHSCDQFMAAMMRLNCVGVTKELRVLFERFADSEKFDYRRFADYLFYKLP